MIMSFEKGHIVTQEIRDKISASLTGHVFYGKSKHSDETKKKMSDVQKLNPKAFKHGHKIRLGVKHTEESRLKMSKSHSGKPRPWRRRAVKLCVDCLKVIKSIYAKRCHPCGMKVTALKNRGRKASLETRKKLRESHVGQVAWNKGKGSGRKYLYYPSLFTNDLFREEIKKRDDYICQGCGVTEEEHIIVFGRSLDIHHIDYVKTNLDKTNLVTTCRACNARANHNKQHWIEFYKKKIAEKILE